MGWSRCFSHAGLSEFMGEVLPVKLMTEGGLFSFI